jgi:DNA-binding NarL/FixJ family response regulator
MKKTSHELVIVSDNRLLAEATGTALVSEGAVSSYFHLRYGQETEYLDSMLGDPAIVVMDVTAHVDRSELFSRIRRFARELPTARIVAIGDGQSAECVTGSIESGASTFVLAGDSLGELAFTVKALRDGHSRCSGIVIDIVLRRIRELSTAKQAEAGNEVPVLTEREIEVLELVEQGLLNKEISRRLGICLSTTKNHLHSIFHKLQVSGRRQAVRQGIAVGVLACERKQDVA